jgi:L-aminopeptidase/D-esterase-like protein
MPDLSNTLTDIAGFRVGHAHDMDALTGCTVVLCPPGVTGGVDQRGGAPGTRETDLLRPMHLVNEVHAVLLSGGSAYGLDAASGVMRYLEEQGIGVNVGVGVVPIVPAAVIFDLALGEANVRPDAAMGYHACQQASDQGVLQGNVGAGAGATVGKLLGMAQATKSGLGCATLEAGGGVLVSALMVVNVLGEVIDPESGRLLAGTRRPPTGGDTSDHPIFISSLELLRNQAEYEINPPLSTLSNTAIGVVATNAQLSKEQANKVAQMAHDGLARSVRPAHTLFDGDTIFALASGEIPANVSTVGAFAAEAVARAVVAAVLSARPAGGLPAAQDVAA